MNEFGLSSYSLVFLSLAYLQFSSLEWCSRVLKGHLSGDILSHLIIKESSKWTWWWYLIQVNLAYLFASLLLDFSSFSSLLCITTWDPFFDLPFRS